MNLILYCIAVNLGINRLEVGCHTEGSHRHCPSRLVPNICNTHPHPDVNADVDTKLGANLERPGVRLYPLQETAAICRPRRR